MYVRTPVNRKGASMHASNYVGFLDALSRDSYQVMAAGGGSFSQRAFPNTRG